MKKLRYFLSFGIASGLLGFLMGVAASPSRADDGDEYLPPPESADRILTQEGAKDVIPPPDNGADANVNQGFDRLELQNSAPVTVPRDTAPDIDD